MKRKALQQRLLKEPLFLDGATGTHLQAAGLPPGHAPELWVLDHTDVIRNLQQSYFAAGSDVILTPTFGGNRAKLGRHLAHEQTVREINRELASLSISVRDRFAQANPGRDLFVAGDIGPTGQFLFPVGDLSLTEMIDIYQEQARGLLDAGVDLFMLETMLDLSEIRAAVIAIREISDLPIMASLTFSENGRTLSGNSPLTCLLTLAALGADVVGINCSFGPSELGELIDPLRAISPVPLLLKPNAGLPVLVDGKTVFPMDAPSFARAMQPLAHNAVSVLGGCCGTGPDHIRALRQQLGQTAESGKAEWPLLPQMICSARQVWPVGKLSDLPQVAAEDPDNLADDVMDVISDDTPAVIIDFCDGVSPGSVNDWLEAIQQLQMLSAVPLIFRSEDAGLLSQLLHYYCGRAGIIGPLPAKNYGALQLI